MKLDALFVEVNELVAEVAALRDQVANLTQWQPIETAPKDGTEILVCNHATLDIWFYHVASWMDGLEWWNGDARVNPTHWMPLPQPPE